jgi:hypothetical protein
MTTTSSTRAEPGIDVAPTEPDELRRESATTSSAYSALRLRLRLPGLELDTDRRVLPRTRPIPWLVGQIRLRPHFSVQEAVPLAVFHPTCDLHVVEK